ncbi:MAG: MarR family transcriptional regulator [Bacteroidetes bacterium]|nr:MarR family transcriptional regulator [Bacteroidota bacterium]
MKLELELKNSKPLQSHQRATLNIMFTASWLDCMLTRQLRPYGLTGPQYNILRILNGSFPKGLSVLDIKSRMIDRSSNVSRLVEKLRLSGLVERVANTEDRRMVIVSVSEAGKKLLSDIENANFINGPGAPGGKLSEGEALELAHLLDKFRE